MLPKLWLLIGPKGQTMSLIKLSWTAKKNDKYGVCMFDCVFTTTVNAIQWAFSTPFAGWVVWGDSPRVNHIQFMDGLIRWTIGHVGADKLCPRILTGLLKPSLPPAKSQRPRRFPSKNLLNKTTSGKKYFDKPPLSIHVRVSFELVVACLVVGG